jgi:hypothetical protein
MALAEQRRHQQLSGTDTPGQALYKATFAFAGDENDSRTLSFAKGEELVVLKKHVAAGDGWWEGRTKDGRVGIFPGKYVAMIHDGTISSAAVKGTAKVDPPTEIEVEGSTPSTITLKWVQPKDAAGEPVPVQQYRVTYKAGKNKETVDTGWPTDTFTIEELPPATNHSITVRTVGEDGIEGRLSLALDAKTKPEAKKGKKGKKKDKAKKKTKDEDEPNDGGGGGDDDGGGGALAELMAVELPPEIPELETKTAETEAQKTGRLLEQLQIPGLRRPGGQGCF